jgi:hypothetical protein
MWSDATIGALVGRPTARRECRLTPNGCAVEDISVCRDQAVPALLRIGSQFANELLEGVSPELEKCVRNTGSRARSNGFSGTKAINKDVKLLSWPCQRCHGHADIPLPRKLYDDKIQTTHRLAVSALESEQVLGRCLGDAPLLKSTLSAGDYAEYEVCAWMGVSNGSAC